MGSIKRKLEADSLQARMLEAERVKKGNIAQMRGTIIETVEEEEDLCDSLDVIYLGGGMDPRPDGEFKDIEQQPDRWVTCFMAQASILQNHDHQLVAISSAQIMWVPWTPSRCASGTHWLLCLAARAGPGGLFMPAKADSMWLHSGGQVRRAW